MTGASAAIFFNDVLAIGALERFRELNVGIPTDISVMGCDDIFGASFCGPALTTVTSPGEIVGQVAADLLISLLSNGAVSPPVIRRFSPHLTIRESTGPAPSAQ